MVPSSAESPVPAPPSFSVRLLFPFHLPGGLSEAAAASLTAYTPTGESQPVWQRTDLHDLYTVEALRESVAFLFPSPNLQYFTVHPAVCQRWFRATTAVVLNGQKEANWRKKKSNDSPRPASMALSLDPSYRIELFLLHGHIGLLSFAFCDPERLSPHQPSSLIALKDCFYHLSHTKFRVPVFRIPHPATDPDWAPPKELPFQEELALSAPLASRLSNPGQPFCLAELRDLLLKPLASAEFLAEQNQFLVHSVLRFPLTVDFSLPSTRLQLFPELVSFAQLEEAGHPLSPPDDLGVPCEVLSSKHAAAFAYLGAAHFVADQHAPDKSKDSFDAVRVEQIQRKYFLAYAASLTQRLLAHRFLEEAVRVRRSTTEIAALWDDFCTFEASAQLIDVSRREAVNRTYRLAQSAQRVPETLASLHRVFRDVHATEAALRQHKLQTDQEQTRHRLGLIEIFIVTVYTAEFTHILGEIKHFPSTHLLAGVLGLSALAFLTVLLHHRSATHHPGKPAALLLKLLLVLTLALFFVWLGVGLFLHLPAPVSYGP